MMDYDGVVDPQLMADEARVATTANRNQLDVHLLQGEDGIS